MGFVFNSSEMRGKMSSEAQHSAEQLVCRASCRAGLGGFPRGGRPPGRPCGRPLLSHGAASACAGPFGCVRGGRAPGRHGARARCAVCGLVRARALPRLPAPTLPPGAAPPRGAVAGDATVDHGRPAASFQGGAARPDGHLVLPAAFRAARGHGHAGMAMPALGSIAESFCKRGLAGGLGGARQAGLHRQLTTGGSACTHRRSSFTRHGALPYAQSKRALMRVR